MLNINLFRRKWFGVLTSLALMATSTSWAQVDTMASVKQKGKIVVGVKADYKPFGYTDPSGKIVGMEIDLANDIAKRLGVAIEMIPVTGANRMEFVKQGRIDMLIATMAYRPDRAEKVSIPQPLYYRYAPFKGPTTTAALGRNLAHRWWYSRA